MRLKGYMSIFFGLSILCICALLFAMAETARMAGARWYLQTSVNSAIDSVFSLYHRELWEQYRLLFVEYESEQQAEEDFRRFLSPYLEADTWYPMVEEEIQILNMTAATDSGGDYLEAGILDYMKYGIWETVFEADRMEPLYKEGKEAEAVREIAGSYRGNTRSAWRLEESLEQIQGCLKEQEKLLLECYNSLSVYDGTGFCKNAGKLLNQLNRMPALVKNYEKQADALSASLDESAGLLAGRKENLSESVYQGLEQEIQEYVSYVAKDGERRVEIEGLIKWSESQTGVVRTAISAAEEVIEILSDWDDEEEEPDEASLWGGVSRELDRFDTRLLSVSHGIQDKEKQGWLEQAEAFLQLDLLAVVLPEGIEPVGGVLSMNELPSNNGSIDNSESHQTGGRNLANRLLVTEYCGSFFSDFRQSLTAQPRPVFYEMEYLFAGGAAEERNLELTVRHLLLLREGYNLMHIFSDSQKRAQARELAVMIVGGTGIAPLIVITTFLIMSVWALGEAMMDLRLLMDGKKVPLIKLPDDWQLSLEQLLKVGRQEILPETKGNEHGLTYEGYLKYILFFTGRRTLYYRIMDIIQMNIRNEQDSFRMEAARYRLDIQASVMNKHVFLTPAFISELGSGNGLHYQSRAQTKKAY